MTEPQAFYGNLVKTELKRQKEPEFICPKCEEEMHLRSARRSRYWKWHIIEKWECRGCGYEETREIQDWD